MRHSKLWSIIILVKCPLKPGFGIGQLVIFLLSARLLPLAHPGQQKAIQAQNSLGRGDEEHSKDYYAQRCNGPIGLCTLLEAVKGYRSRGQISLSS